MGYIFDFNDANAYDEWFNKPRNRFAADLESRLMIDILKPMKAETVLDIGCGSKPYRPIFRSVEQYIGLEIPGAGGQPDIHADGLHLPFADATFDTVLCNQVLEHVPDPALTISACTRLLKDDGSLFLSTLNRNPKSYLFAVIGAEYVLGLLPKGTHDYSRFIRPSEMESWARECGLHLTDITGLVYNPLTRKYRLNSDVSVNYMACFQKA